MCKNLVCQNMVCQNIDAHNRVNIRKGMAATEIRI
jgi:hypothetical protein